MTPSEYVKAAMRTHSTPNLFSGNVVDSAALAQLLHAGMLLTTEAGEFLDALKKTLIYGRTLDRTNLVEELGDAQWGIALACHTLGISLEEVMKLNIEKLKRRFPDRFTTERALSRDLDAERQALEGK